MSRKRLNQRTAARLISFLGLTLLLALGEARGEAGKAEERPLGHYLVPRPLLLDPADPWSLARPQEVSLLLFLPGAAPEFRRDPCRPAGIALPDFLRDLVGRQVAGKRLAVFSFCGEGSPGRFQAERRKGETKLELRRRELRRLLAKLQARGLTLPQIFLLGQSQGGWLSLSLLAEEPRLGGAVAFAPAFAGPRADRSPGWSRKREEELGQLTATARLPARLYLFSGDPYEAPEDLAALTRISGLESEVLSACDATPVHLSAYAPCLRARLTGELLDYLRRRHEEAGE